MQKIILMTDIHICDAGDTIIDLDPLARFQATREAALLAHPDAQMMILMGDVTHHGRETQYERLQKAIDPIPIPVVTMLGNHDRRDAYLSVFADAPQTASGHIQSVIDLARHRIITLDTLDGPPYPKGHHSGYLCAERLTWLQEALAGAGDKIPLVFSHHPPFETGILGMDLIKLRNGGVMLDILAQHPKTHLFCGHIHRTISGSSQGVPWTMLKSTCHQGVLDFNDPDSSLSIDEPSAYGLLVLVDDGVVAHSEDVGATSETRQDKHSQSQLK